MFSEKYTVKVIVDNSLLFTRNYTTYQAILDDFPVFQNTESVRTCKRMLEMEKKPKYKKSQKYQHIQVTKKTTEGTVQCICDAKSGDPCICCPASNSKLLFQN
jgi:hypothetical protein